jgi:SAM-dependent methyltransferase
MFKKVIKGIVKECPLCGCARRDVLSDFNDAFLNIPVGKLNKMWVSKHGFNPIAKIYHEEVLLKRTCGNCGLGYYNFHLADNGEMYEKLNKKGNYYHDYRPSFDVARGVINEQKPQSVLEIGCGNGAFLEFIRGTAPHIVGNEYNKDIARKNIEKGLNVTAKDIFEINEQFDIVASHEVLEHVWNTHNFLEQNLRLTKKGGKLIFGCPKPNGLHKLEYARHELQYPPHHQFDFSHKTFEYLAKRYNLKIDKYVETELEKRHFKKYFPSSVYKYNEISQTVKGATHVVVYEK